MWLLNQVGHSQWEPCLPELLWKKHRHLPRSWKRPVGLFQGSEQESYWNEEGPFAAEFLENHCPHKQMAIFQLVLEGVRKERKDSFIPNSQYLVFLRRSWPSLHTSTISKGTRMRLKDSENVLFFLLPGLSFPQVSLWLLSDHPTKNSTLSLLFLFPVHFFFLALSVT